MIEFDNLSKRYEGGFEALSKISFKMEAGEMAFLTGRSGAGKSTLLKLLIRHTTNTSRFFSSSLEHTTIYNDFTPNYFLLLFRTVS